MELKNMHSRTSSSADSPGLGRIRLTRRQQQALVPDRHLSVTANAGSGKTAVLVERYVRLLLDQRATMDQIVVLTFTEKAAGELRRRIASALLDSPWDVQPDKRWLCYD
jgi:ATP-dependent exoDNAse (exonuclease V) beta subunit